MASLIFQCVCICSAFWVPSFRFSSLACVCCVLDLTLLWPAPSQFDRSAFLYAIQSGTPHPLLPSYQPISLSHHSGNMTRCSQPLASVSHVTKPQQGLDICVLEWGWAMLWAQQTQRRWCRKIKQVHDSKGVWVEEICQILDHWTYQPPAKF